jgi:hypothetical protein
LTFVNSDEKKVMEFYIIILFKHFITLKIRIMTEYLLLFRNASATNGYLSTPEEMAKDMPKWQAWIGGIAMQGKLVSTAPIRYDAAVVTNNDVREGQPYKEANSVLVSGYLICKADSIEELQELSKQCPILQYPESSVEIRPLIPFPIN